MARPIATARTRGAFLGGLRLMAIDGTTIDVADTPENDRAFGRPTTRRGDGAFPQIRVLALIETGTHVICDAVHPPLRHRRGADRAAAAALGRPGHAAAVGSGLPLV